MLGPVAVVKQTGEVFRLSVDPHHPLAVAATLDPPTGRSVPPERRGLSQQPNPLYCGDGELSFTDDDLNPERTIQFPYRNPPPGSRRPGRPHSPDHPRPFFPFPRRKPNRPHPGADRTRLAVHEPPVQIVDADKIEALFAAGAQPPMTPH